MVLPVRLSDRSGDSPSRAGGSNEAGVSGDRKSTNPGRGKKLCHRSAPERVVETHWLCL